MRSRFSSLLIAATATLTVATASPYAHAVGDDEASPTRLHKGIVGGALLGGESVMLVEAAFGVRSGWAYLGGGLAGAAAGGFGGHLIEQDASSARLPMFLLAGGLVLAVPTWVAVAATTAYRPPANYVEDRPPADEPVAEPPQPSSSPGTMPPAPHAPTSHRMKLRTPRDRNQAEAARVAMYKPLPAYIAPPSLVGVDRGLLSLSVPSVELRDVYSKREMLQTGLKQATEVRIPVFNLTF